MMEILQVENAPKFWEQLILYVALSSCGFAAFLIGVSNTSRGFFRITSGGLILAGLALLCAFSVLQLKSDKPMLNLRIFRYPTFRISVILSLCLYLIAMGSAMIVPIFTKSICGYSDTAYGLATLVGAVLSVFVTLTAGKLYDRVGIKPLFIVGISLFTLYSVMGHFFTPSISIIFIAAVYALQNVAMSSLLSPSTAMALSGLEGKDRVDGSAIFNTLRQISSSLASTLAVLIYTLTGSNITGVHCVYTYFGFVTLAILVSVILYLKKSQKNNG